VCELDVPGSVYGPATPIVGSTVYSM